MQSSFFGYLSRYVMYFVIIQVIVMAAMYALTTYAPDLAYTVMNSGGVSGLGVVTLMLPAILVGQYFYRTENQMMPRGFGWGLALVCSLIAIAISLGGTYVMSKNDPYFQRGIDELMSDPAILQIVLAVIAVFVLLATKIAFWSGARGERKKEERLAAKLARKEAKAARKAK